MSRWSAERLRIGLAPERAEVARLGARFGRQGVRVSGQDCVPADGQPVWQAALDALQAPLQDVDAGGAAVAVVLSNHFVRYLVLPWQAELSSAAETHEWARLRFEQTYGAAVAGWTIRCCDGGYGQPLVACAVDGALLDQLGATLAGAGLRLVSLQPLLMAAYNDARGQFRGPTAFAIVEAGRVCLSLLDGQGWQQIASRRAGADAAAAIEQELATVGATVEAQPLAVMLVGEGAPWPAQGAPTAQLLGPTEAQGRRPLALCGVR